MVFPLPRPLRLRPAALLLIPALALAATADAGIASAAAQQDKSPESAGKPAKETADDAAPSLLKACEGHDAWDYPAPPVKVYGNTWYVGTCGITALLVTSPQGDVLIDAGVAAAAPLLLANIRKLGREPRRVRMILATHDHFDHVGGLAALQRATGATVAALPVQARVLATGRPEEDDPQAGDLSPFDPVNVTRTLTDGVPVTMGSLRFTPHATPVHAPGSTSWVWQSCENDQCRTISYLDSASTISADGYRFTDHPQRMAAARRGLATMAALPCGILLTPHPGQSDMFERLAGEKPLYDPSACRTYAREAGERLTKRLASERG
ncbi:subclass B3 metallo-beta-lactamase [Novosphingobium sp. 9]|uniref:subclass B3 metallo-beta-lactamase n=1 Tax=Novosphingobium sp. 9 TaxID=2025349 RepID=UPI0021B4E959|nr:subclass B3 metallo-beta-lactamase [Novosphingobium sp. 9]